MRKNISTTVFFTIIILAAAMAACSMKNYARQIQELEQRQTLWENQHITHYQLSVDLPYETTAYGELPMPLTVEVKDGNVVLVMDAQGNIISPKGKYQATAEYYYRNYFTVPGLFSYLHEYYLEKPPAIEVTYDATLGYPDSIYIDPYTEPCCQDFTIAVRDFQILP